MASPTPADWDRMGELLNWGNILAARELTWAVERDAPNCAHCGHRQIGMATIGDQPVCHPSDERESTALDCYRLVTVYHEPLGSRKTKS